MDETTRAVLEKITVRYDQEVQLPSGHRSKVFYDCARLSSSDLARLAAQAVGGLEQKFFDLALGIAYSGILFAVAIGSSEEVAILQADKKLYGPSLRDKKVIVVIDVVVSGRQLEEAAIIAEQHGAKVVGYACIVDRSDGKVGSPNLPLFSACSSSLM